MTPEGQRGVNQWSLQAERAAFAKAHTGEKSLHGVQCGCMAGQ